MKVSFSKQPVADLTRYVPPEPVMNQSIVFKPTLKRKGSDETIITTFTCEDDVSMLSVDIGLQAENLVTGGEDSRGLEEVIEDPDQIEAEISEEETVDKKMMMLRMQHNKRE